MNILVIGAGRIGSTFAFHLSRAGHQVSVLARGERLAVLLRAGAILSVDGTGAPVQTLAQFDASVPYDLILVTVLAHQVEPLLPALAASQAATVMLMFNTFQRTAGWRATLGPDRFAFGFPNMTAFLDEGRLRSKVDGPGMVTTVTCARWAAHFKAAGMPSEVEADMDSFLRSHVAFVVPLMVAGLLTWQRRAGLGWAEAGRLAAAHREGLALVQSLGHVVKPGYVALLARLPGPVLTGLVWALARTAGVRNLGQFGPGEVRVLIDAMVDAAPKRTVMLRAIRP